MIKRVRYPAINTVADAGRAFRDTESFLDHVPFVQDLPPVSGVKFLVQDSTGAWSLYDLVAGAGVTLTLDEPNKTVTVTSP